MTAGSGVSFRVLVFAATMVSASEISAEENPTYDPDVYTCAPPPDLNTLGTLRFGSVHVGADARYTHPARASGVVGAPLPAASISALGARMADSD